MNSLARVIIAFFVLASVMLMGSGAVYGAVHYVNSSNYTTAIGNLTGAHTVVFSPGTYASNDVLVINQPLSLVSDTGDYRTSGTLFQSHMNLNSAGASVKGFVFDKDGYYIVQVLKPNVRIEKNSFVNSATSNAIFGAQASPRVSNLSIVNNYFANISGTGIILNANHNSLIEGNVFTNVIFSINARATDNLNISNNKFNTEVQGASIVSGNAILMSESANFNVKGNVIQNSGNDGSSLAAAIVVATGVPNRISTGVIENNTLVGNDDAIAVCNSCRVNDPGYEPSGQNVVHQVVIRNNSVHSNVGDYDLVHGKTNVALNASYNYWGGSEGLNLSRAWGNISYSPYYADESLSSLRFAVVRDLTSEEDNVFRFNESGVVQSVNLNLSDNASSSRLVMGVLNSRPESTRTVPSHFKVYRYFEVTDNVSESLVEGASITFTVPMSWLSSNRIDRDAVELLRFSNGRWVELDAGFVIETVDDVTYSANTSGFSFFAITGVSSSSSSGSSGGRGSRGGSAYIPAASTFPWLFVDRQAVNIAQILSPDKPFVFDTSKQGIVVTSVALDVNTETRNAVLVAASLKSRPSSISADPEGTVYRYVGVATDNVNKAFIDGITTTFAVSKEWMSANNAGNENVALFAYDNASASWINVGTRMKSETDDSVLFEADTRGSEIFAIVSQGKKTETETPAETEEPEAPTPPADAEQDEIPAEPETTAPEPETTTPELQPERSGLSPVTTTVIIVLAAGIAFFAFTRYRKKKKT